jgi:hypothetical protein
MVGASVHGNTLDANNNASPAFLYISNVQFAADYPDVVLYTLLDMNNGALPVCGSDSAGQPVQAVLLGYHWSETDGSRAAADGYYTFACSGFSLAKCAWGIGYAPWRAGMTDYHQSCTRMLRSDYCGHLSDQATFAGTPVNVVDNIGIQFPSPDPTWQLEAYWGPNGAACVHSFRHSFDNSICPLNGASFQCPATMTFGPGALIRNDCQPDQQDPTRCVDP